MPAERFNSSRKALLLMKMPTCTYFLHLSCMPSFDFIDEEQNVSLALSFPPPTNDADVEFSEFERKQLIALGHKSCMNAD